MQDKNFRWRNLRDGLSTIFRYGMLNRRVLYTAFTLTIVIAVIDPIDTYLIGKFIDSLTSGRFVDVSFIQQPVPLYFVILAAWFFSLVIETVINRAKVLASLKLNELTRTTYIANTAEHVFRLPISFHKSIKIGEFQERTQNAASAVGGILGDDIVIILPQIISTIIFLAVLYILSPIVFIIVLVAVVLYVATMILMVPRTVALQRQVSRSYSRVKGILLDSVMNIRIIKDFVAEKHQAGIIRKGYQDEALPLWYKLKDYRRSQILAQQLIVIVVRTVVLSMSIYFVTESIWTIGDLIIANSYIGQIFNPLGVLSNNWLNIQNGIIAIEEVEKVVNMPEEAYVPVLADTSRKTISGDIEFRNVAFGYSVDRNILEQITFTARSGQIIALVGESGVGKSTLVELISGYHFPTSGDITIDGTPIREVSLELLRSSIGVVTQELTLFNDTIRNNIRFGNFLATNDQIEEAARKAHCDFIYKFPEKWEQVVGERGLKLSVGQKQRVAIARAILKNPRILILDEPTSALDAGSEKIISESLDILMKGKTTFVVAHRLSTVRRADKILVFKDGKIVESGTHSELLTIPNGEYRRLYELQIGLHE